MPIDVSAYQPFLMSVSFTAPPIVRLSTLLAAERHASSQMTPHRYDVL